jgi:hypothetical protein
MSSPFRVCMLALVPDAAYLMDHMGAGSNCRLLRALGHQASEPPGGTFSPSAPKLS